MLNSERTYLKLMFCATRNYATWDPEIIVKAGDYGRFTRGPRSLAFWRKNGTFVREGNIYTDGKADEFGVPSAVEYGGESEGEAWVTSSNATQIDTSLSAGGLYPLIAQCKIKATFKFSSGCAAVLAMENPMITIIDPPGALKRLLEDPIMRGMVVVSEVHSCSSYARILSANKSGALTLGLQVEPPVPGTASASTTKTWVRQGSSGNFKSQTNTTGERAFCPLFRLVSLFEEETSTGIRPVSSF
ncbi:hypothetical protein K438DRAFT_2100404 [Mycena galopus ATCC 62051]|nr:hypothetical protein K438DRAFT_2100404 [Mycena galopus ATCC 62051]